MTGDGGQREKGVHQPGPRAIRRSSLVVGDESLRRGCVLASGRVALRARVSGCFFLALGEVLLRARVFGWLSGFDHRGLACGLFREDHREVAFEQDCLSEWVLRHMLCRC